MSDAAELAKKMDGNECPEGEHEWEKEYDKGAQTGDRVCRKCGKAEWMG